MSILYSYAHGIMKQLEIMRILAEHPTGLTVGQLMNYLPYRTTRHQTVKILESLVGESVIIEHSFQYRKNVIAKRYWMNELGASELSSVCRAYMENEKQLRLPEYDIKSYESEVS